MNLNQLFSQYYAKHALLRTRYPDNAFQFYKGYVARWGDSEISVITRIDIQNWVDEVGIKSKTSANKAVNLMSAVINWGLRRGYLPVGTVNPCIGVERFKEKSRERFLSPVELGKFKQALDHEPAHIRDFFWMLLLVGARRGNVQQMRWQEIDLDLKIWQFQQKNGDTHCLPLTDAAMAILARRKNLGDGPWVFPSPRKPTQPLLDPRRAWSRVLKRSELTDLHIHDLRRTVGSYMALYGFTELIIGKTLGHRDPRSTRVYARLNIAPVREALEKTESVFFG